MTTVCALLLDLITEFEKLIMGNSCLLYLKNINLLDKLFGMFFTYLNVLVLAVSYISEQYQ